MDFIYIVLIISSLSLIVSVAVLFKLSNKSSEDKIVSELKSILGNNNLALMDLTSRKISESEQNQLREIMRNQLETVERMEKNTNKMTDAFLRFSIDTSKTMNENFNSLNDKVSSNLERINMRVEERLKEGFEKTNTTFVNILERISKIDEAQKKIDSLSTNIVSLQDVLTDKKSRGTFGEVQLNNILSSIFGDKNTKIYEIQKKLPNDMIADAILYLPEPVGMICVDSKFPLENYQKMLDKNILEAERKQYEKDFKANVKKHINDISSKYIISSITSEQAIMFIPAEAIFAELNAYHQDLLDYASAKKVWLASPTTLMSVLSTVQIVLRNMEREKYADIIHNELNNLGKEFKLYKERWDSLSRDIKKVYDDVDKINITSNKIEKKFNSLSKVDMSEINSDLNLIEWY